jgi:hypothetical protein
MPKQALRLITAVRAASFLQIAHVFIPLWLRIAHAPEVPLVGLAIPFWSKIISLLIIGLIFLDRKTIGVRPSVLSDTCHLPTNLHAWGATCNLEAIVPNLLGNIDRSVAANAGELIAKIGVERVKPTRKFYFCLPYTVEHGNSVIDIFHIRRFDEGVGKILPSRITRMVDPEAAARFMECSDNRGISGNPDVAMKIPGKAPGSKIGIVDCKSANSVSCVYAHSLALAP